MGSGSLWPYQASSLMSALLSQASALHGTCIFTFHTQKRAWGNWAAPAEQGLRTALMGWIHGLQAQKVGSSWGRGRLTLKRKFLSEKLLHLWPSTSKSMIWNCLTVLLLSKLLEQTQIVKRFLLIQEQTIFIFPSEGEESYSEAELPLWEGVEGQLQQQ